MIIFLIKWLTKIKITDDIFFKNIFMSIISSIIILLTKSSFKHQHNISSIFCYFLVMSVNYNHLHIIRNGFHLKNEEITWKMQLSGSLAYLCPYPSMIMVLSILSDYLWTFQDFSLMQPDFPNSTTSRFDLRHLLFDNYSNIGPVRKMPRTLK